MIYFDKMNLKILRRIKRSGAHGVTMAELCAEFPTRVNKLYFPELTHEEYVALYKKDGAMVYDYVFENDADKIYLRSTTKANELLERRCFDFWKWIIPTLIAIAALIISFLGLYQITPSNNSKNNNSEAAATQSTILDSNPISNDPS